MMEQDFIKTLQTLLDKQADIIKQDIKKDFDQFITPISNSLKEIDTRLEEIEKNIKAISFDIKSVKIACLELLDDSINHIHSVNEVETSKPIRKSYKEQTG